MKLLLVESKRNPGARFSSALERKGYQLALSDNGSHGIRLLDEVIPSLIIINAASLRTSGKRICRQLREKLNGLPIVVIIGPDQPDSDDGCATAFLKLPFTARKLLNRIQPLLPGDGEHLLHVGLIRLDTERRRVRCQGREARLTPRLAQLLQILMEHPGAVVERAQLFRQVWKTEYTEDTRTLDVHISWLREALEEDPRHPQFLKTIRGVGYRLDASS